MALLTGSTYETVVGHEMIYSCYRMKNSRPDDGLWVVGGWWWWWMEVVRLYMYRLLSHAGQIVYHFSPRQEDSNLFLGEIYSPGLLVVIIFLLSMRRRWRLFAVCLSVSSQSHALLVRI